jgi:methionyl-tRNA formyltransferase
MKFVYCGFDFFGECLRTCLQDGHELIAAFCQPVDGHYNTNNSIRSQCAEWGILLQERAITIADINEFQARGCDFLLSAAYSYKIPADELANAKIKGMNIHPSFLPEGRGPWPLPHVILKGLQNSGVSIHKLAKDFDVGDILLQERFDVMADENLETLSFKSQMLAAKLVQILVQALDEYWQRAEKQEKGSYWPMPSEVERTLAWEEGIDKISTIVRAFGKFESYAHFAGQDWLIQDASVWKETHLFDAGQVVRRSSLDVVVAAIDGFVCIRQFKPEPVKQ